MKTRLMFGYKRVFVKITVTIIKNNFFKQFNTTFFKDWGHISKLVWVWFRFRTDEIISSLSIVMRSIILSIRKVRLDNTLLLIICLHCDKCY